MSVSPAIHRKASRLLVEGRVTIRLLDGRLIADVVGDHDRYHIEIEDRGPRCPCPSRTRPCSHEDAVARCTGWQL
jgi:hypothetical protein